MSFDLFMGSLVPPLLHNGDCDSIGDMPAWQLNDLDVFQSQYQRVYPYTNAYGHTYHHAIDAAGMGKTMQEAKFLCFMELVERFCALSDATIYHSLQNHNDSSHLISWNKLCPYSTGQIEIIKNTPNPLLDHSINAKGLLTGWTYSLPAFCAFPRWRSYVGAYPLPIPESDGSGIASGFAWEPHNIIKRALCEVIERDCVMLSWRAANWKITNIKNPELQEAQQQWIKSNGLSLSVYNVGDPNLIPVIMAVLGKKNGENITVGSSCGKGRPGDIHKAVAEAIMLQRSAMELDAYYGSFTNEQIDCSEMHVVYAWRNGKAIVDWYKKKAGRRSDKNKRWDITMPVLLQKCLHVYGEEPVVIDFTDPRIRNHRYRVFRVMQPNAYKKEYEHNYFYKGGKRLTSYVTNEKELNTLPHPIG